MKTLRNLRWMAAVLAGATATYPVTRSHAEESPAAQAAALTPPRLVRFVEAARPDTPEAQAGGEVELVLTLDATGAVTDVVVAKPAGAGLDEAAVAAARQLGFEPARKDGVAVPARIRYVYAFAKIEPVVAAPATGRLEGRVLDRAGGEPLVGADVVVESPDGAELARGATDAEGGFAFDELPPGRYHVRVTAFEYGQLEGDEEVVAGEATSLTYRLAGERVVRDEGAYGATAVVEAPAREVTSHKLRGAELTSVAGTRGDALRAVELLPGVARPPAGAGLLIVRGSAPWDSGVMLDGADVPILYHFGGLTSFVPSGLLESIDFYPGNFSVKYGRRTGGIIEVGLRDPRRDALHGAIDVNLIDSSFQVEGPLGQDLSFFAAARRSYMDVWFESVIPSEELGVSSAPVYWDWQGLLTWKPGERDRVRVTAYGSADGVALVVKAPVDGDPTIRGRVAQGTGFNRGSVAWRHRYAPGVEHDVSLTTGSFDFDFDLGPELSQRVDGTALYGRAEWRAQLGARVRLTGGLDVSEEWGEIRYRGPRLTQFEGNPDAMNLTDREQVTLQTDFEFFRPAVYAEASVRPLEPLELIGGVRSDYYSDTEQVTFDPRLVARWSVGDELVLKGGVGHFSQPPEYGQADPVLGSAGVNAIGALHADVGVEWAPRARTRFVLDGFYKDLDGLIVADGDGELHNHGDGRIYGLEASARLAPGGCFSGFASYTLSRSERNDQGVEWRRFDFDQTHILSAAGQLKLGRGWTLGGTLRLVSGSPSTPVVDRMYDADRDVYRPIHGRVNSERNPTFHQLDLRVEKGFRAFGARMSAYLDLQNAYNARHVEGETWNYDFTRKTASYGLPILPSFGVKGEL